MHTGDDIVHVWQFRSAHPMVLDGSSSQQQQQQPGSNERVIAIDNPAVVHRASEFLTMAAPATADPIAAIAAGASTLVVARASGVVHRYQLPSLALQGQHLLRCRPQRLALNCDATRLGVIDVGGAFSVLDASAAAAATAPPQPAAVVMGVHLPGERKVRVCVCGCGCGCCCLFCSGGGLKPRGLFQEAR
jgi:WD repeat-containing protein 35